MLANYFVNIDELEARFIHLEALRKEVVKEFEEIFFYEMEEKKDIILSLSSSACVEDRYQASTYQEAFISLSYNYWAKGHDVRDLIEEYLFMQRWNYEFFKGEWYKVALHVEEILDEMDKVFNLILAHHKRELRKELREVKLKIALCNLSHGDILRSLKRRLRRIEDELEHPTFTKEKLLANK